MVLFNFHETLTVIVSNVYLFYVSFAGRGLEGAGLGLGLGLEGSCVGLGLGIGLEGAGLGLGLEGAGVGLGLGTAGCNEVHLNYVKCIIVYTHITLALYRLD